MPKQINVTIPATAAYSYPIFIGTDLIQHTVKWLPKNKSYNKIVIITDHTVKKHYGSLLQRALKQQGYANFLLAFPAGEQSKTYNVKQYIDEQMLGRYCGRDTLILALGGGVVGDLAGFVAATYMRGIPYVQIPTTLLAMVDSSVGGKTAINTVHGKNMVGAFYQPTCVVIDINFIRTLTKKHIINGLIESIKMFLIQDKESFIYIQKNIHKLLLADHKILKTMIHRAIKIKTKIVMQDEKEQALRMILNYGHTIGHALEKVSNYKILHGIAVGYGMLVEAKIAELLGLLDKEQYNIINNLIAHLGLQGRDLKKYEVNTIIRATKTDKKSRSGSVHYILLSHIGSIHHTHNTFSYPVEEALVKQALKSVIEV